MRISYNTDMMHQTAKSIQKNADDLQRDTTTFWTHYQTDCTQSAIPQALQTILGDFSQKDSLENVLSLILEQRQNIGQTLDQAASHVDEEERKNQASFTPR